MLFVGSDTGPMHLAAAFGVPCVAMYGPTRYQECGPYGVGHLPLQVTYEEGTAHERRSGRQSGDPRFAWKMFATPANESWHGTTAKVRPSVVPRSHCRDLPRSPTCDSRSHASPKCVPKSDWGTRSRDEPESKTPRSGDKHAEDTEWRDSVVRLAVQFTNGFIQHLGIRNAIRRCMRPSSWVSIIVATGPTSRTTPANPATSTRSPVCNR